MRMWLIRLIAGAALLTVAIAALIRFSGYEARQLRAEIQQLEVEKGRLIDYADRLTRAVRVAQVEVLTQAAAPDGRVATRLRWTEIAPDGVLGPPVETIVFGTLVYFDALVIKFEYEHVAAADPQRTLSLHLFRRLFGNQQTPDSAAEIGRQARARLPDRNPLSPFETELWQRFWQLADDPEMAKKYGVRIAQVEAPAAELRPGEVWDIYRDAAGGLNIRKLGMRS